MPFDWNPLSILGSAVDWTVGELDQAYRWSSSQLGKLAGWSESEVKSVGIDVAHFVVRGLDAVEQIVWHVAEGVHHVTVSLGHDLATTVHWASGAVHWVAHAESWGAHLLDQGLTAFNNDVLKPAEAAAAWQLRTTRDVLTGNISDLQHQVQPVANFVYQHAEPILNNIGSLINQGATAVWHTAYNEVVHPIESGVAQVEHDVAGVYDWLDKYGLDAVKLVLAASDWLVWMAEHSVADVISLAEHGLGGISLDDALKGAKADASEVDAINAAVRSFFG